MKFEKIFKISEIPASHIENLLLLTSRSNLVPIGSIDYGVEVGTARKLVVLMFYFFNLSFFEN